jgi:hypothetical protein
MTDTEETFTCGVVAANFYEADTLAWQTLARYFGEGISRDKPGDWTLSRIVHAEEQDEEGKLTGKLVSSATFTRHADDSQADDGGGIATEELPKGYWDEP